MNFTLLKKSVLYLFFCLIGFISTAQTTVEKQGEEWQLLVDGASFEIKGVTFGYDDDVTNYDKYFRELKYLGVNSIRTWGTDDNSEDLLNAAQQYGIKVMLGIWMRHGRPGGEADDSFDYLNDEKGKEAMYTNALEIVRKYKDHPALLTWGIGNEVYLNIATDEEKRAYSKLLQRICAEIKTLDPKHPITSVSAWTFGADWWSKYVPAIDIYGINSYGPGTAVIQDELTKMGIDKPYIVTEFGARGEWSIEEDENGVKPEPNDEEKYETIATGYHNWISNKSKCLGVYVFHYATDDKFGGPYLLTHYKGMTRPQYWAIRQAYTGNEPENYVPQIQTFSIPVSEANNGTWIPVELEVDDREKEKLQIEFYYNQRIGSRKKRDQIIPLNHRGNDHDGFEIQLPKEHGGIKVYAVAIDDFNNAGIATTSIAVMDEELKNRKYRVPRPALPFYVYGENEDLPYSLSAYMGNYEALDVDLNYPGGMESGKTCIRIHYNAKTDWYGLGFVDPPGDWGDILGGYDIRGAKMLSFWARVKYGKLEVSAGFGLIEDDKPFPDTAKRMKDFVLTNEWQEFKIKIKGEDLSCLRSGFVIFSSGQGRSHEIYLDDIVFE